ncbi:MAG: oligosaccharide flippase family protein [Eubacterium sp.]
MNLKTKYLSSAFLMLVTTIIVKIIGAIYKIPLTSFIGAVGRGYFAYAYNLCMPVHAITMGVFPIALSKLVSKYNSLNNEKMSAAMLKAATRLFSLVGFIGMAVLIAFSKPYSVLIAHSPKSIYTILVLAPSVMLSCMSASYRGYYEGFLNMVPTSVSQTIEALFKLIFGLLFAKYSMSYLYAQYVNTGFVLNNSVASSEEALSLIYPLTSACAMLGVTLGTFMSLVFLLIYKKINSPRLSTARPDVRIAKREILTFSFPIMISSCVQSVFQFLDTASVQLALNTVDKQVLQDAYQSSLSLTSVSTQDIPTYLYGIFSASLDFKNLVPGVTMALGVCAVPAVSRAFESKNKEALESITNSIFKYTSLLSLLGGLAIAIASKEMLSLFYGSSSQDIVLGANDLVRCFSITVSAYSLAGVAVFTVQAVDAPEKSIMPFLVSGIARVALNFILIRYTSLLLLGTAVSGAIGYFIIALWNSVIIVKQTHIRLSLSNIVVKPALTAANALILYIFCEKLINNLSNLFLILLIKASIFAVFFCILCFCFKLIDIKELLSDFAKKKMV